MTAVSQGMDVERVRQAAQSLLGLSRRLGTVRTQGDAQLSALEHIWSGDDFTDFSDQWRGTSPDLTTAADALNSLSRELHDQAEQQQVASGGAGRHAGGTGATGGRGLPTVPGLPGQDLLDRIIKGITLPVSVGLDVAKVVMDALAHPITSILQLASDIKAGVEWLSPRVSQFIDEASAKAGALVRSWAPKIGAWADEWLPKIGGFGTKFDRVLPGVGLATFVYDEQENLKALWNGELSPRDAYDLFTGGTAAVAGCFPPVGTALSAVLTADSLRMDALDWVREEHPDWDHAEAALVGAGYFTMGGPMGIIGSFLPDEKFEIPGPSPKEKWESVVDLATRDVDMDTPWAPRPLRLPVGVLPASPF